jgi:hypothetical protein
MNPTPFSTAFPHLAAQIDAERPLISAALLDILVTDIRDDFILAEVTTQHSYDLLTSSTQHDYLNRALTSSWRRPASVSLTRHIPSAPPPDNVTPALDAAIAQSNTKRTAKRTANTLTFTERAALQFWMQQADNAAYVANESDTDAAIKATQDLAAKGIAVTAGNISGMRKILGIDKVKKTPPPPAHDIDLVALQAQVQQHHLQLDPIAGLNLAEALVNLRDSMCKLEDTIHRLREQTTAHEDRLKSLEASND